MDHNSSIQVMDGLIQDFATVARLEAGADDTAMALEIFETQSAKITVTSKKMKIRIIRKIIENTIMYMTLRVTRRRSGQTSLYIP